jgi:polar amino acid transport system substrate-binding protein
MPLRTPAPRRPRTGAASSRAAWLVTLLALATIACSEGGSADGAVAQAQTGGQAARPATPPARPCRLTLGWEPKEPYEYRSVDGALAGLDIELVQAILTQAHCELLFAEGRWVTLVRRLQRGEVDVLAGAPRTPARETFALFSDPYRTGSFALYVRKGDATVQRSTSLQALLDTGFRLGIREEYSYGEGVDALQEDPHYADQFIGATLGDQNYQRLLDLEIDGFLEDPVAARIYIRKRGLQEEIEVHPLPIYGGDVALMFSRSVDPAIVARINAAIAALKTESAWRSIVEKYAY